VVRIWCLMMLAWLIADLIDVIDVSSCLSDRAERSGYFD
jgi:hypothetical protein